VVAVDHLGFGLSDKPSAELHTYSLFDHGERLLEFCRLLELEQVHVLAHDMGDSVTTEMLTRIERGMAPGRAANKETADTRAAYSPRNLAEENVYSTAAQKAQPDAGHELVKSVTFTNGGMVFHLINQRAAQRLLTSPFGPLLVGWTTDQNPRPLRILTTLVSNGISVHPMLMCTVG
jgi:hypothetical protein